MKGGGRQAAGGRREPANKLSPHERQRILNIANTPEFAAMAPNQIVPTLADRNRYIASESSFYRVLREADQLARRGKVKAPTRRRPLPLQASAPNQLWSWDITYLATTVQGVFFYLYLIMDVYSRKIVGWSMQDHLLTDLVVEAFDMAVARRNPSAVIHHSDQGCQYTSFVFSARCAEAGAQPSMGSVGDAYDNAMCESFFATLECELLDRTRFRTRTEADRRPSKPTAGRSTF